MFGSSSPFGASTPSLFGGASPSSSPFGASSSTTPPPFGMNTAAANPFGAKPFGSTTNTFGQTGSSLFGNTGAAGSSFSAPQPSTPFGTTTPTFGGTTAPASPFGATQSAFGTGVFGQQKAAPFGSFGTTTTTPQSNPFGAPTPVFGQQQTQPAFGVQPTPAFGQTPTPAFGGQPSPPAFSTQSTSMPSFGTTPSAFGAPTTPAFSNPFPSSPFGGGSTSVFGQPSTPAPAPAFGTTSAPSFTSTPAFGQPTQPFNMFGQQPSPGFAGTARGSRVVPYVPKSDPEGNGFVKLMSISAMDQYKDKSVEELRCEDYQAGDKGGPSTTTTTNTLFPQSNPFPTISQPAPPNPFGSGAATSSLFAPSKSFTPPTGTSTFGTANSFATGGATTPSLGFFQASTSTPSSFTFPSPTPAPAPTQFNFPQQQQPASTGMFTGFTLPTNSSFTSPSASSMFTSPQIRPPQQSSPPLFQNFPSFSNSQPQTSSLMGTTNLFTPSPMQNTQTPSFSLPTNNPIAPAPAPSPAPFGNMPQMPQMTVGRSAGSSPSVQYGISSTPISEKPASIRSTSLLTPRYIAPRSKVRMNARRSATKKENPKVSFFSDGEDAPVTPKADVSFIPREDPRALFIHPMEQSPATTPIAVKSDVLPDGEPKSFPVADDDFLPKESPAGNVREEHAHRGNGYISMSGHRAGEAAVAYEHGADIEALMPKLKHSDYYTEPRIQELAAKERAEPNYCRRVPNFVVGRKGYGHIKFLGETDVRRLDIEGIVQFNKCEVLVYMDESKKPPLGQGLNKPADVTLLNVKCIDKKTGESFSQGPEVDRFAKKLKKKTEDQDAQFISYDSVKGEWTFRVKHFSRYGLDDSDDESSVVETAPAASLSSGDVMVDAMEDGVEDRPDDELGQEVELLEEEAWQLRGSRSALPHSLPAQLRLNPTKMHLLKTSFFPAGEEEEMEDVNLSGGKGRPRTSTTTSMAMVPVKSVESSKPTSRPAKQMRISPYAMWQRSPAASPALRPALQLQEQAVVSSGLRAGFRLQEEQQHIAVKNSRVMADAALFMGASFRVGWGPHGVFVHSGSPVGQRNKPISSCLSFERVALDRTARDEQGKIRESLVNYQFVSPLSLHFNFSKPVSADNAGLNLRKFSCSRTDLRKICDDYEVLAEKQHNAGGVPSSDHLVLRHQVMTWQLISVLFSEKDEDITEAEEEETASESMAEVRARIATTDPTTKHLVRRAEFSSWLQDSVFHLVQADLDTMQPRRSCMREILTLLTGKQVAVAVEKAILEGDIRLAVLLSQAAGSVMNRQDMIEQVELWESEGIDEELMDIDRLSVFKLLGGDIRGYKNEEIGVLAGQRLDWKRFLGLLMWYGLPPETELGSVVGDFRQLVEQEGAPFPAPMYLEEGGGAAAGGGGTYDSAYYLMLLHASGGDTDDVNVKAMLSSASTTFDYLDHRTAWHQKAVLEAIGVVDGKELHLLDMSFVGQLLAAGLVHWAVYVVLHMPTDPENRQGFHEKVVKEILGQYCEVWSSSGVQRSFLSKELGIPSAWLHEAMAVYWNYCNNPAKALEHYMLSGWWQEAHVLYMTKVSAELFLNLEHGELWNVASKMEEHKMEIDGWDLGAGLYIDFLTLKGSFHDGETESKMGSCRGFFERLKESRRVWESRATNLLKMAFTRMADEVASLLVDDSELGGGLRDVDMFVTALEAPVPEDVQLCRLQAAMGTFVSRISQGVC